VGGKSVYYERLSTWISERYPGCQGCRGDDPMWRYRTGKGRLGGGGRRSLGESHVERLVGMFVRGKRIILTTRRAWVSVERLSRGAARIWKKNGGRKKTRKTVGKGVGHYLGLGAAGAGEGDHFGQVEFMTREKETGRVGKKKKE